MDARPNAGNGSSGRRWRFALLALSLAGLLAGGGVAAWATYAFVRDAFPAITSPVAEFDEGQTRTIRTEPGDEALVLCIVVDDLDDPVPALDVTARSAAGDPIETTEASGWASVFGRNYRRVLNLAPPVPGELVLRVQTENKGQRGDFAVFRHPDATMERYARRATPWWVAGGSLALAGVAGLLAFVFWCARASGDEAMPL